MDYMLDIFVPKTELNRINLLEVFREWGGEIYPLSPSVYVTDSNIEFIEITDLSHYNRIINLELNKELIGMHLKSDIFNDFEIFANNQLNQGDENALLVFLKSLFSLSKFYILLLREDEIVKEKYEISNVEELEYILLNSVNWASPKDVLLFK